MLHDSNYTAILFVALFAWQVAKDYMRALHQDKTVKSIILLKQEMAKFTLEIVNIK